MRRITVSVIGGHECISEVERFAHEIGRTIAEMGCVLVCGGLEGVMRAASQGAQEAGGLTIGLLPGNDKNEANPFIDIPLPTSIGYARNALVACSADIIVALPGSHGTRSEISYGFVFKRPLIDCGGWGLEGMVPAQTPEQVRALLQQFIAEIRDGRAA